MVNSLLQSVTIDLATQLKSFTLALLSLLSPSKFAEKNPQSQTQLFEVGNLKDWKNEGERKKTEIKADRKERKKIFFGAARLVCLNLSLDVPFLPCTAEPASPHMI